MNLSLENRKTIVSLAAGFLLFGGIIYLFDRKGSSTDQKVSEKDIEDVVGAYQEAMAAGESEQFLTELNKGLMEEYGLTVSLRKADGKFIVKNKAGNIIRVV